MKKIKIFLAALAVAALFVGCSKEPRSLDGTVWERAITGGTQSLIFSKTQCEMRCDYPSYPSESWNVWYSYEFNYPTVILYPEYSEENKAAIKCIINDDTMSVVNMSTEKTIGIFTKK